MAQSHLRGDLTPSHWSHAALISTPTRSISNRTQVLEASLEPFEGFQIPSMHNGLQIAPLRRYQEVAAYPNVAVIRVPVNPRTWRNQASGQKSVLRQFADQRVVLDVTFLILEWLGFVWCAGNSGNPLLSGHGIPTAAVIESLLAASGYDMSSGLDTSASSPEAFWQTAKWWQDYFTDMSIEPMTTRYCTADEPVHEGGRQSTSTTARGTQRKPSRRDLHLPAPRSFAAKSLTAQMFRER